MPYLCVSLFILRLNQHLLSDVFFQLCPGSPSWSSKSSQCCSSIVTRISVEQSSCKLSVYSDTGKSGIYHVFEKKKVLFLSGVCNQTRLGAEAFRSILNKIIGVFLMSIISWLSRLRFGPATVLILRTW